MAPVTRRDAFAAALLFPAMLHDTLVLAAEEARTPVRDRRAITPGEPIAFPERGYALDLTMTLRDLPLQWYLRAIVPKQFDVHVTGTLSSGKVNFTIPLYGVLPDYTVDGKFENGALTLHLDRGPLENCIIVLPFGEGCIVDRLQVYRADRQWRRGGLTMEGHGRVCGNTPSLTFIPVTPEKDSPCDRYVLEICTDLPAVTGTFDGRRGDEIIARYADIVGELRTI